MKRNLLILPLLLFVSVRCMSQYDARGNTYLSFLTGYHYSIGSAQEQSPSTTRGTYYIKGFPIAFAYLHSRYGNPGKKFGLGYYLGLSLGGFRSQFKTENTGYSNTDHIWNKDFEAYIDLRLGLQCVYRLKEKQTMVGLRYFNWYNGGGIRPYYGNADETAALGLFGAYKRLGVDLNIGNRKTPGVLINSNWNYTQLELRYKIGNWDKGNFNWMVGTRIEHTVLSKRFTTDTQSTTGNFIQILIGYGVN